MSALSSTADFEPTSETKSRKEVQTVHKFDIGKLVNKRVGEQYRQACSKKFEPLLAALNKDQLESVDKA